MVQNRIQHAKYDQMVTKLLRGEALPQDLDYVDSCVVSSCLVYITFERG